MRAIALLFVVVSFLTVTVSAQETPTTSYGLAQAGFKAYQEGKYDEAVRLLDLLVQKYPTGEETPNGRYLLGLSYYSLGKYAEGVKAFGDLKGLDAKALPIAEFHLGVCLMSTGEFAKAFPLFDKVGRSDNKELLPYALLYYARAKFEQARQQPTAARQAAADGIAKVDQLVKNYADSEVIPDAIMTKANLLITVKDFAQAAQVLDELKAKPEGKEFELDIDYLLGFAYTQQAKGFREEFKPEEAAAAIKQAREVYTRLAGNENLIIANQAAFELANLDYDAAQVAPADTRAAAYQKAIDAYRSLKSKDELVASQTKVVEGIRADIAKFAADAGKVKSLTRLLQREQQKLAGVQAGNDQTVTALLRIADCYQRIGKFDESRLVCRAALSIAGEEQAASLHTQIIISYALQGQSQKAEEAFTKFQQDYANDQNMVAVVSYAIGIAYTKEGKYEDAIKKFDQIMKNSPTSKVAAGVPQAKANAYLAWGKVDEALKSYDDFIKNYTGKIDPEAIDSAKLARGYALVSAKKYADAIKAFQDVAETAKNPAVASEALLRAGDYLSSTSKQEQAIEVFRQFIQKYPDNPNVPSAAYSIGMAYEGQKKYTEAIAAYQDAIGKYADDQATQLKCYERVWRCYSALGEYENMVKAQDAQVAAFPGNERNMAAYYDRGKYLEEKGAPAAEIAAAYMKVTEAYDALPVSLRTGEAAKRSMQFPSAALLKLAGLYQREAAKIGNLENMPEDRLGEWKECINSAYQYADLALQKYNQNNLGSALQNMNKIQLLRIKAKLTTVEDATTYLSKLAGMFNNKADAAQIMIARAAFVYELDNKAQALNFYKEAFASISNPTDISWQDYDRYGSILLDNKNWQEAKQLFETLMATYQNDPADTKSKNTYDLARASATYGLGAVEAGLGNAAAAEEYFKTLKEKYPWSAKLLNADYQRALVLADKGEQAEAFKIWKAIMASTANNNEMKSRSIIAFAQTLIAMGDKNLPTEEVKQKGKPDGNIYELAASYGLKAYFFYPDEPVAPEGLYLAVSVYSKKLNDKVNAQKWFEVLSQKYPTSPWTAKAQGQL